MFFVYEPYAPIPTYFDYEQAYEDYRGRQYVAALHEQQRRAQFKRELALEEERHRRALAAIGQQEAARRQRQVSPYPPTRRPHEHISGACVCGHDANACIMPDSREIFRRRQARQQEEERLSRQFHQNILSQIFGVPPEEMDQGTPEKSFVAPISSILAQGNETPTNQASAKVAPAPSARVHDKPKESAAKAPVLKTPTPKPVEPKSSSAPRSEEDAQTVEIEPHWSAAPDRAKALAELTSVTRAFTSLKNTFVFPSGPLEQTPDISGTPRLAYNQTNAAIHAYQHALSELLTKLDGIESYGFKGVREARKQLVVKIEKEMEELEKRIAQSIGGSSVPSSNQGAQTLTDVAPPNDGDDAKMKDANDTKAAEEYDVDEPVSPLVADTFEPPHKISASALPEILESTDVEPLQSPVKEEGEMDVDQTEPVPPSVLGTIEPVKEATAAVVPEVLASTEVEPLESQAKEKEAMDTESSIPENSNPSTSANAPVTDKATLAPSHEASHTTSPRAKSFTVSDDDSEIEDAVKTVV